jgi:hypothetical protein
MNYSSEIEREGFSGASLTMKHSAPETAWMSAAATLLDCAVSNEHSIG